MKLSALVVMVSMLSPWGARAEDTSAKSQPAGSCMPIGLTASGETVFPWDCREIIEKQRGPVSVNVPSAPSDPQAKDQSQEKDASPAQAAAPAPPPPQQQPQIDAAADHAMPSSPEAAARPVRAVSHLRPKRLAAAPLDKKRQIASQPVATSTSTGTTSIKSLFSR